MVICITDVEVNKHHKFRCEYVFIYYFDIEIYRLDDMMLIHQIYPCGSLIATVNHLYKSCESGYEKQRGYTIYRVMSDISQIFNKIKNHTQL